MRPASSTHGAEHGWLELILGCMFSGKTSALEKIYRQYAICNIECMVVNFAGDTRYSSEMLSTHDKTTIPCTFATELSEVTARAGTAEVILINEGQFFPDLVPWVEARLSEHKTVYVCGLDGDFRQRRFGSMLDLIPRADMYTKLTALCANCRTGARAPFTYRKSDSEEQRLIGTDEYMPVCRACNELLSAPPVTLRAPGHA